MKDRLLLGAVGFIVTLAASVTLFLADKTIYDYTIGAAFIGMALGCLIAWVDAREGDGRKAAKLVLLPYAIGVAAAIIGTILLIHR